MMKALFYLLCCLFVCLQQSLQSTFTSYTAFFFLMCGGQYKVLTNLFLSSCSGLSKPLSSSKIQIFPNSLIKPFPCTVAPARHPLPCVSASLISHCPFQTCWFLLPVTPTILSHQYLHSAEGRSPSEGGICNWIRNLSILFILISVWLLLRHSATWWSATSAFFREPLEQRKRERKRLYFFIFLSSSFAL